MPWAMGVLWSARTLPQTCVGLLTVVQHKYARTQAFTVLSFVSPVSAHRVHWDPTRRAAERNPVRPRGTDRRNRNQRHRGGKASLSIARSDARLARDARARASTRGSGGDL